MQPGKYTRIPTVGLMLGKRRRRWPDIKPRIDERLVLAGGPVVGRWRHAFDVARSGSALQYLRRICCGAVRSKIPSLWIRYLNSRKHTRHCPSAGPTLGHHWINFWWMLIAVPSMSAGRYHACVMLWCPCIYPVNPTLG